MFILPDLDAQIGQMRVNAVPSMPKLTRKPHRKVKTGCKTCRIRRVKCDENRPNCLKCTSTGRTCDGYLQHRVDTQERVSSYAHIKSMWPIKALATLPDFGNDMHYLEFYYHCVGPKLSGRFDTEFWSRKILQMAHVEPGVRSALIALGHLSQRQSGSLQHARRSAVTANGLERRPFWVNYNKAIRSLIDHMTKPSFSAEVGLVICLLFACIEFLQADANVAFTHIRSGLNIVYEMRKRNTIGLGFEPAEAGQQCVDTSSSVVEQVMVPILSQALASALPYGVSLGKDFDFLESCPRYFTGNTFANLTDARSSFFDLRNAAILLARDMAVKLYGSLPLTSSDRQRQADLLYRHHVWLQALRAFETVREPTVDDAYALSALQVGYHSSYTACSCIMDKTQMVYDSHLEDFRLIVAHANHLVNSLELPSRALGSSLNAAANFTFDTSFIPALFFTAIRCRCPITRRKAVELLALDLPREGLWDPEQHRKVAERVIEIEEIDVDAQGWPVEASRLCRCSVGTEVDNTNGFQAEFLYTKDLIMATERSWSERLTLGEGHNVTFTSYPPNHDTNRSLALIKPSSSLPATSQSLATALP